MNKIFLIFILSLLCFTLNGQKELTANQEDQWKTVVRNYPFPSDGNDLLPQFLELYKYYFFPNPSARDSIWQIINSYNEPYSQLDSATYYIFKGFEPYFTHEYEGAVTEFNKAKLLFEKNEYWTGFLESKRNIANILYFQKIVQEAYDQYNDIYHHPEVNRYMKSRVAHNMGALLMELELDIYRGEPSAAKDSIIQIITGYLREAIRLTDADDPSTKSSTYSILIDVMLEKNDLDSALFYTNKSFTMAESIQDENRMAFVNIKKSALLDSLKRYDESLVAINEAIEYFESVDNFSQINHSLVKKSEVLKHMGRVSEAYDVLMSNADLVRENLSTEFSESLAENEAKYETASKELKIKNQEITIAKRTRWMITLASAIVLLTLLFIMFRQKQKRKIQQEKNTILIQSKQDNLNAVINAQEDERKRIAKDLHDGIVQQLGGLKLGLQKLVGNDSNEDSKKLMTILDNSTEELRELSHKMMPKALSELGLIPALEDMLENSLGHTEILYRFEHFGISGRIEEKKEIAIYRIAQELINNVIKHSSASEVNIQLFKAAENLVLIVEDNGRGFKSSVDKNGIGLMNISSRLDTVNGNVNFEASPESGTLATIKVPL